MLHMLLSLVAVVVAQTSGEQVELVVFLQE
jgi:hypothetical protein